MMVRTYTMVLFNDFLKYLHEFDRVINGAFPIVAPQIFANMTEQQNKKEPSSPVLPHAVMDSMQFGATGPNYTWRKGGTENPEDNHLWLITGSATDVIVPKNNALIEINPDDKVIKFWGTTHLMDGLQFEENSLTGSTIKDGSITTNKLEPNIRINGSALSLTNSRSINGIMFDGTSNVINYASCTTAGNVATKTVNVPQFKLIDGAIVAVKFENAVSVGNITLNVTGTGNIAVHYHGKPVAANKLLAKTVYHVVYDGTVWNIVGDLTSTMTDNKTTQTLTDTENNYPLVFTGKADQVETSTGSVGFAPVFSVNPGTGKLTVPQIVSKISGAIPSINNQTTGSIINVVNNGNIVGISSHRLRNGTVALVSGMNNGITVNYTTNDRVDANSTTPTYQATLLDDKGNASFPNKVTAKSFEGTITQAIKATQDNQGRVIDETYITKQEGDDKYINASGDTMTGILRVPQIAGEANTNVSTVGWTQSEIAKAKQQLKDEIIGDTEGSYDTIKELMELVKNNSDVLVTLQNATNEFVSFNKKQNLTPAQKSTAASNIGVITNTGNNVLDGSLTVNQTITANNGIVVTNGEPVIMTKGVYGTNPSTELQKAIRFLEANKQGSYTELVSKVQTNGSVVSEIRAAANKASAHPAAITLTSNIDGTAKATAPTPAVDSNDTSIATTAWVKDAIDIAKQDLVNKQTYTSVKATGTTLEQGMKYFGCINPQSATDSYRVKFVFTCTTPFTDYNCSGVCEITGIGQKYSYKYWINRKSDSIIAFDAINYRQANNDAITTGKGHYVAFSLTGSNNPNVAGYERTFTVSVVETEQCTFNLLTRMTDATGAGIVSSNYQPNSIVDVAKSGFYFTSAINYGDRLAQWGRLPVAGTDGLKSYSLVAYGSDQALYSIVKADNTFTTAKFDPSSLMFYTGPSLNASMTNNIEGQLFSSITFDGDKAINVKTSFSANQRVYLEGKLDPDKWLFTAQKIVDNLPGTNTNCQYVLIGYSAGQGTKQIVLASEHTVYAWHNNAFVPVSPNPFITTADPSDNSNRAATTKYTNTVIKNSWVNPSVRSNERDTNLYIRAKDNQYTSGTLLATDDSYFNSIKFMDGTNSISESNCLGTVESFIDNVSQGIELTATNPSDPDQSAFVAIDYLKSGSTWVPKVTTIQPPSKTDRSDSIATTKFVMDNLDLIDGGVL